MAILALVTLSGCSVEPPQDCKVAFKQGFQCTERYRGKSDREMLLACIPFTKPERITGAWVHGFETNEFYEGESASAALIGKRIGDTELEIEGADRLGPSRRLFQMDFIGRRSRCDMGFPRHIIIVERIKSQREVFRR